MSNFIARKLAGPKRENISLELKRLAAFNNPGLLETPPENKRSHSRRRENPPVHLDLNNQDQESFEEAIEEMALTEQQVSHLIQQHVGDGFLELEDLIGDYAPEDITIVDLTGFTGTHTRYKQKSRSLVLSTALNSKAVK